MKKTVRDIAERFGGEIEGDGNTEISGVNSLDAAKESDISFILSKKNLKDAENSAAGALICGPGMDIKARAVIRVPDVKSYYVRVLEYFYPAEKPGEGVSKNAAVAAGVKIPVNVYIGDFAVIGEGSVMGEGTAIFPGVSIGKNCRIGKNTRIYPNVSVYDNTVIGAGCIIHSGAVIGSDGFGFTESGGKIIKVPQAGRVVIGNNVEIGANCGIDRAAFGETIIGDNVKLDNLVQIAHNCVIGENTVIAAQTGVAGSSKVGKNCMIGGQVGVADHISVGDGVKIGSQAGVSKRVPDGAAVTGTPARPIMKVRKDEGYVNRLEDLFRRVKALESEIKDKK